MKLHTQIFIGLGAGVALGAAAPQTVPYIRFVGEIFLAALKMLVVPLIFASVVAGVTKIGDGRHLGRLGARALGYYGITTAIAVLLGLFLVNLIKPGIGADLKFRPPLGDLPAAGGTLGDFFHRQIGLILRNPVQAMANGDFLAIIAFALLLGAALVMIRERGAAAVAAFESVNEALTLMTRWLMRLAPFGVFALIASIIAGSGLEALKPLAKYMITVLIGLLLHAGLILTPLVVAMGRMSATRFWGGLREVIALTVSTCSSAATLPVTMRCVQDHLGVSQRISSFVLPIGTTVNMNGTALYEAVAALFIAQAYGIELSLAQQGMIFLTAIGAAVGAAGIPSAGLVTMAMVLSAVGLPLEGIGLILAVDRFLDMFRTTVNVLGDAVGAVLIARWEGETLREAQPAV